MATQLQIRRGTSTQVAAFTGAEGEIVVNTTNDSVHVNDGSTAGGFELARADLNNVSDTSLNAALTGNTVSALTITTLTLGSTAITATGTEINLLDGVTATTAELNYVDGVTSAIQTQIDAKAPLASPTFTGTVTADGLTVDTNTLVVDATNNRVGIGTSTVNRALEIAGNNNGGAKANYIRITDTDTSATANNQQGGIEFFTNDSPAGIAASMEVLYAGSGGGGEITFNTNVSSGGTLTEALRIDENQSLLVGTSVAHLTSSTFSGYTQFAGGHSIQKRSGGIVAYYDRLTDDGDIMQFRRQGTTVGSIGAYDGRPYLASSTVGIRISNALFPSNTSGVITDGAMNIGGSSGRFQDLYLSGQAIAGDGSVTAPSFRGTDTNTGIYFPSAGVTAISRNGVEGCRLDASGNLLVGTTDTNPTTGTSEGIVLGAGGIMLASNTSDAAMALNRTSTNGDIAIFKKDGTTVGRLSNDNTYFFIAGGASGGTHSGLRFVNNSSIRPCTASGANSNNVVAFGATTARWTVIYATTGTINTSDRREKQDIEALSDAEQRVAVAAKGLLRKFRWIDAVEAKGDDARIHFGIIAQDLQDAFTAEGLDAGRYAMFCSDTFWIDTEGESYETQEEAPEGATEQTRLGVRYSELLAFIISAI